MAKGKAVTPQPRHRATYTMRTQGQDKWGHQEIDWAPDGTSQVLPGAVRLGAAYPPIGTLT